MSGLRLPSGGGVDRGRPLAFTFDGKPYLGFEGDSIASALIASGVSVVGRSFKYHRPRGIWGAWTEEPNAIVDVTRGGHDDAEPARHDRGARERPRRALGQCGADGGRRSRRLCSTSSPRSCPPVSTTRRFSGRAGRPLRAAFAPWPDSAASIRIIVRRRAIQRSTRIATCLSSARGRRVSPRPAPRARAGRAVILVDDHAEIGGQLIHRGGAIEGASWRDWALSVVRAVEAAGGRVMTRTTAYGVYDDNLVCAWERRAPLPDALWRIRPKQIVVAAGAIERPLVAPDNDRPGVMSADAALVYLRRYAVLVGKRIAIATNNDSAYPVAEALAEAGAEVEILNSRASGPSSQLRVTRSVAIEGVVGARGVEAVRFGGRTRDCDALLLSGGWSPTVHLYAQARGRLRYDEALAALVPMSAIGDLSVAGAANGAFTLDEALRQGHQAGGGEGAAPNAPAGQYRIEASWPTADDEGRRWIDFQTDVTLKDVALAAREGYVSVEHLKRYTTLGMATDQGKTANVNGIAALAALTGRTIEETGATTYRPPFVPVPMGVIAGRRRGALINPLKRLPLEAEHRAEGAQMREYGGWLRPAWYGPDDPERTVQREAARARDAVALFDGSSLGKIEIIGPDAGKLADFNSYNRLSNLKPGKIRYGLLLSEAGVVFDDGVTLRLGEDRFLVSCSSGHTDSVRMRLELARQDRFDPARVVVHDATAQWATLTVTGPRARDLIEACGVDVALDDQSLPHMAFATGAFDGAPLRVARVSFTGDRSYELSVPARRAAALRARLAEKLPAFGGGPLELEALMILRAEKGYIIVGKDTDGTTMPHDLGLSGPRTRGMTNTSASAPCSCPSPTTSAASNSLG